jgi:Tfp pilus assembly protein PilF
MIQEGQIRNRHVIARWNPLHIAQSLGELNSVSNKSKSNYLDNSSIKEYQTKWIINKNIFTAIDFASSALLHDDASVAQDAFDFIRKELDANTNLPPLVRRLLLDDNEAQRTALLVPRAEVNKLKKHLIEYPRDSIMWVELAWHYLVQGQLSQSERALRIAHNITPNNRHVIRSFSRFYVHTTDIDKAIYFATKNDIIKNDPWVVSNQIAISNTYGKTSWLVKHGVMLLNNSSINPGALSELASELGTMDFTSGDRKKGKKKFVQAYIMPHENAMAQISWVDKNIINVDIPDLDNVPYNYEAKVHSLFCDSPNWDMIITNIKKWAKYQPISLKPITLGSYIAVNIIKNYELALELLRNGKALSKNDCTLVNNYIYTLILMGRYKEAESELASIDISAFKDRDRTSITATRGLMEYRYGDKDKGHAHYIEAAEMAKSSNNMTDYYYVLVHLAREQLRIGKDIGAILMEIDKGQKYTKDFLLNATIKEFGIYS